MPQLLHPAGEEFKKGTKIRAEVIVKFIRKGIHF
jgi:hypothetical protein